VSARQLDTLDLTQQVLTPPEKWITAFIDPGIGRHNANAAIASMGRHESASRHLTGTANPLEPAGGAAS